VSFVLSPEDLEQPHVAPELERLIPLDLTTPPMEASSVSARDWRSSPLRRALKRLDVDADVAMVVNAIGGSGPSTLTVTMYAVPGISAERLMTEFEGVDTIPGGTKPPRTIAGREVSWRERPEFTTARWARDGMVVAVAGDPSRVEAAIERLP
jgi:hypothetical protein